MIHLLLEPASKIQIIEMLQDYDGLIKIVVDIRRGILAGGWEMHSDNWYASKPCLVSGKRLGDLPVRIPGKGSCFPFWPRIGQTRRLIFQDWRADSL